jgi:phage terminase large subunit-like protein
VKKTLVPGERFEPENLERCLEAHPRARVVVPVNNPGGAGYEALLKCLRDRGAEKTIAVDVLGDVLTSAYRPVSQTRGEKPNPEASGGSLEGKRRGKEHAS